MDILSAQRDDNHHVSRYHKDCVYNCSMYGAFELYAIHLSQRPDLSRVRQITVEANVSRNFPTEIIYQEQEQEQEQEQDQDQDQDQEPMQQQAVSDFLTLRGPNCHRTLVFAHKFRFECVYKQYKHTIEEPFVSEWDVSEWDENDGVDIIRTRHIKDRITVSYEWITSAAWANFQFSFLAKDASTPHNIQNLNGVIQVSALKQGTTRTLGSFHNDCFISGETLPLLRSSAAFPTEEPTFTVTIDLSYLVDGLPKKIVTSKIIPSPQAGYGVFTEIGLNKAKDYPDFHEEHLFGAYPKLQMNIFWLTNMTGTSVF